MDIKRFRVRQGDKSPFRGRRPDDTGPFDSKGAAEGHVRKGLERLQKRQELLYAQDRYALLLVFQGMDAAGKDSVIGHVMHTVRTVISLGSGIQRRRSEPLQRTEGPAMTPMKNPTS